MRVLIEETPFARQQRDWDGSYSTLWPASWVSCPDAGPPPFVTAYRLCFGLTEAATARAHVTADERYELFLNGVRIGRGPERGGERHWFFETYDLPLEAGPHLLVARVWSLGSLAPVAQASVRPGFLLAAEQPFTELLSTGTAAWETKRLTGYEFVPPGVAWGTGAKVAVNAAGTFPWDFHLGAGDGWRPVQQDLFGRGADGANHHGREHLLRPAVLPAMLEVPRTIGRIRHVAAAPGLDLQDVPIRAADHLAGEQAAWQQLLVGGGSVTMPSGTVRRVLIDLDDYFCAYPELVVRGGAGAVIRVHWAESLYERLDGRRLHHSPKGNRDAVEGKFFAGVGDTFLPDGGDRCQFETLWWSAGRYVEVVVRTANEPLVLERLGWRETRYPLEPECTFTCGDLRLEKLFSRCLRTLQTCAHETYLDCPYYEQLMYVGDTRLQALTTYALIRDDRLPRKALLLFDASRGPDGRTRSQYPSRTAQFIPPFSLWWIGMVHDHALWRDDAAFVRARLPGVRAVLDYFLGRLNGHGLLAAPDGWNFVDWVPGWEKGVPPDGVEGVSGILNAQLALALGEAARLESGFGRPALGAWYHGRARALTGRIMRAFWDRQRALFADDLAHRRFSEHMQALALLGPLRAATRRSLVRGLANATGLARASIYFSHYLLEAYRRLGDARGVFDRLQEWFDLEALGFKTLREEPEPSRSDCHAWGAHPLHHAFATVLGIRPAAFGFRTVHVQPLLGPLREVRGTLPHPRGEITVELQGDGERLTGSVSLPPGVTGKLGQGRHVLTLREGAQAIEWRHPVYVSRSLRPSVR
jgi:hypothetical protein